jgi:periplasmic divalent cation tolerance protein
MVSRMSPYLQVVTTLPSEEDAGRLARELVERRLAACVQWSGPITSVYQWQERMEESQEWVCTIKTRTDLFDRLAAAISSLHPYDVPEIIATPIVALGQPYARWIDQQVD